MRENMVEEEKNQFAVLIDADNISPKYAPIILFIRYAKIIIKLYKGV